MLDERILVRLPDGEIFLGGIDRLDTFGHFRPRPGRVAAAAGTVVIAGVHSSYGYYVKIDHGNGLQTLYAHCMAGSLLVYPGQKVVAGQAIARVGQTGYATGPHLHFEVIVNGVRVDPKPYLGISRR